jgi:hypothetical protein
MIPERAPYGMPAQRCMALRWSSAPATGVAVGRPGAGLPTRGSDPNPLSLFAAAARQPIPDPAPRNSLFLESGNSLTCALFYWASGADPARHGRENPRHSLLSASEQGNPAEMRFAPDWPSYQSVIRTCGSAERVGEPAKSKPWAANCLETARFGVFLRRGLIAEAADDRRGRRSKWAVANGGHRRLVVTL